MASLHGASLLRQIRTVVAAQCPSRLPDRQLVQQFIAERDEAAFAALVQRHGGMVLAVCRNVLHHQQDAEDVFQAVFLVLARKAATIRKQQALGSWLHGVAYRLALKARARRCRIEARERATVTPWTARAGDDLSVRELGAILHAELQRLPDAYRSALLLCYWEGKTRDEAAAQLGLSAGAFKKRLERARRLLGGRLARRGLAPSAALFAVLFAENLARGPVALALSRSTSAAAVAYAVGQPAAAASTVAVALAEGAIRAMNLTRWATTLLMTLLVGSMGTALGLASYQTLQDPPAGAAAVPTLTVPIAAGGEREGKDKVREPRSDQDRLIGIWRIAKMVADGKDMPADFTTLARLRFTKDGAAIMSVVDEAPPGKYKLVGPGKIDIALDPREEIGRGIYKFASDDQVTLCLAKDSGKKRPTEFNGDKDSGQVLLTLARAKKGEEKPTADEIAKHADPVAQIREAVARTLSANHLKQIGLAMLGYNDKHNAFPLHAIYSKDGKTPLLSRRVAILPYLDQQALYKEFKLDEPWDSTHNKKLIAKMPELYKIDLGKKGEGLTYYQVFTGPDTLFNGAKKSTIMDVKDGIANTLLVIEAKDPVVWTRPADLTLPADKDKMPAVGELFKNGFNVVLCDGSVRFVSHTVEPKLLRSFVTPQAGD